MDLEIITSPTMLPDVGLLRDALEDNYFVDRVSVEVERFTNGATVVLTTSDPTSIDEDVVCAAFAAQGVEVNVLQVVSR